MRWICIFLLTALKTNLRQPVDQMQEGFAGVNASDKYSGPSLFGKIFFGSNYRTEWATVVKMPIFDISKTNFQIAELGGGQQTTSLQLIDDKNREWVLRSVDKNVKSGNGIPNNKIIRYIVQEHVSASYPYAGLSVPDFAHAVGVPAGEQYLYFVPDNSSFGEYRTAMANKVFMLVNRQPVEEKGITTDEMLEKLRTGKQYSVDAKEYLKARLIDWLVADWDRHAEQWRWIERKTVSGIVFYVVPQDRDQAFYRSDGLLVKLVGLFFMPHLDRFNKNARGIKGLSKKSWKLDKQLLSPLSKTDWETVIREFQNKVSDSVIISAVKKQPPEIFAIRGNKLIEKLKSRRDGLLKQAMKYYSFLTQ
ncbi:MAG: hypothetical protein E6H08_09995 [Bacteroidetes bacterium]|nr:MAG: hypothetical protein E6H08_09995 [Bacteroidota bacterium]